jgi:hypothetical protein
MVWLLNGLLNLDSSSEVLHICGNSESNLSLNQAVQLNLLSLVPQLKLYVHILSASRLIPDFSISL